MSGPAKVPSKILADLDAYMQNWRPVAVADNTRVVVATRPIPKIKEAEFKPLKKGAKGSAVLELRVRLAGFGGVLPGEDFDESLEKAVKQFEKDVMARTETGVVDRLFAERLDQFAKDWPIQVEKQLVCPCKGTPLADGCSGFGLGKFPGKGKDAYLSAYAKSKDEAGHKYEYPGIHRSLLWAARALMFYATIDHKDKIKFYTFSSGYRCHKDNAIQTKLDKASGQRVPAPRSTTNHMGKAVDMQFCYFRDKKWQRNAKDPQVPKDVDSMRMVAQNRMNAQMRWNSPDRFALEAASDGATTWVHIDVRKWSSKHLEDRFFTKTATDLDGDSMVVVIKQTAAMDGMMDAFGFNRSEE